MPLSAKLEAALSAQLPLLTELRRDLHRNPELSSQETQTAAKVVALLQSAGYSIRTGVGGTGVVATLGSGSPCVALRADMDALPIQESEQHECRSQTPGVMHACGHDYHTAWLVGVGLVAQAVGLPQGTLKLLFQPAEEAISGAAGMLADGALEDPAVDMVCGAHVWPQVVSGNIGIHPGPNLAAADRFRLRVRGEGTHGASPHLGKDPLVAAAEIVLALQTLVSRRLDPLHSAVVSVCQFHGGAAFNIIPPEVELEGTVRTLRPEDRTMLEGAIGEVATAIAAAHRCSVEYHYQRGVPPTVTDPALTAVAQTALTAALGAEHVVNRDMLSMGAEDFALFLERKPGVLLWVGCAPDEAATGTMSLHHPEFEADERCLQAGISGLMAVAWALLQE